MPIRILVVDDEPDLELLIRQKFRKKIREKDYEFVAAYDGVSALDLLKGNNGIDLILTDINMPKMDGLTLLEKIRELNNPLLKAVVVSAYGDMENIRTAMNRGAFDFVTKPINFEDLDITIDKTLQEITMLKKVLESRDRFVAVCQELEIARNIQLSILPKIFPPFPELKQMELNAHIEPAREVGGDFYDFFLIDEDRFGFVIGDVSGKGIPAAILMAASRTSIKLTALRGLPTNTCIQLVNDILVRESEPNMFVTALYGILNIHTGELEWCNAGHNPPFLLSHNGTVKILDAAHGIPLGFVEKFKYGRDNIKMEKDDLLFLYTDGLDEAMNSKIEDFGKDRLKKSLEKYNKVSNSQLIRGVISDVKEFTGPTPQSDDITLMALKYNS